MSRRSCCLWPPPGLSSRFGPWRLSGAGQSFCLSRTAACLARIRQSLSDLMRDGAGRPPRKTESTDSRFPVPERADRLQGSPPRAVTFMYFNNGRCGASRQNAPVQACRMSSALPGPGQAGGLCLPHPAASGHGIPVRRSSSHASGWRQYYGRSPQSRRGRLSDTQGHSRARERIPFLPCPAAVCAPFCSLVESHNKSAHHTEGWPLQSVDLCFIWQVVVQKAAFRYGAHSILLHHAEMFCLWCRRAHRGSLTATRVYGSKIIFYDIFI